MSGAASGDAEVRPFPWRDLMRFFIGDRGMAPADFWALTLPEIEAVMGPAVSHATRRSDLARLMAEFPDGGRDERPRGHRGGDR